MGSGLGYVTCLLAEAFRIPGRELSVTGLEISPWMVQEARRNVSESYPNLCVTFVNGCMTRLTPSTYGYPDDHTYDAIHVGFAVPDINCLKCVVAMLKPHGWMIAPLSASSVGDFKKMRSIKKFLPSEDAAWRIILGNKNASEAAR